MSKLRFDMSDFVEFVRMCSPTQATSVKALDAASEFAASHVNEIYEDAAEVIGDVRASHPSIRLELEARFVLDRLIELRNAWLRGHGAFAVANWPNG